ELMEGSERRIANSSQTLFVNYFNRRWLNFSAAGVCPDDPDIIKSKIENTLSSSDIVVVTGGTSLGMKDLVPEAMHEIGRTIFAGINMRPGRTITLYEAYGKPVFSVSGLPGPGLTSFETLFEIFISEYLKINAVRRTVPAIASEDIELRKNTTNLKRVKIEFRKDGVYFQPIPRSGLYSLLESDGVIQTDPESGHISRGDVLPVKINGWGV
ncbi:MAG: molybdopterin-binding protein, partial [Candidatus Thermoplasmatota archaeon]|nr:molybdopterin-binding protein [Candidatus Thermoplasmatota archaeon]